MSLLNTIWQRSLPGSGHDVVSALFHGNILYVGTNEYVYRVDPMTGVVQDTNSLPGRGHAEIRLAVSNDGSTLLVGTSGYAIGLATSDIATLWQTSLPNTGSNIVSVVAGPAGGYFGSDGFVFLVDPSNGSISHTNGLSGRGHEEVRLALSLDGKTLYVGTNGYGIGLSPTNIGTLWQASLPGSGHEVVSVVAGDTCAYAGSKGRVYKLAQSDGAVQNQNDLHGRGNAEVRLDVDSALNYLAVGTDGYAIGLDPKSLVTEWQTSLPGSGHEVVSVLAGDGMIYVCSNRYAYELAAETGAVNATNGLSGLGKHEVRLASSGDDLLLWVGTDGYALGLSLEGYPVLDGPWMGKNAAALGPRKLRGVALPGTHDSGTYAISATSPFGIDNVDPAVAALIDAARILSPVIGVGASSVVASCAVAQGQNFLQQLQGGIRYLDLRLQNDRGSMNFVHGLVGAPLSDLIDQVKTFYNDSANAKEVIILDFQHVFGMDTTSESTLMTDLKNAFGNKLIPASTGTDVTLDDLWAGTGRIIVLYEDSKVAAGYSYIWPRSGNLDSPWPNDQSTSDLYKDLGNELPNTRSTFFALLGPLTPNAALIAKGFIPFSGNPDSLLELAEESNPQLLDWIVNDWRNDDLNIVICDWYERVNFVNTVVNLNVAPPISAPLLKALADNAADAATKHEKAWAKVAAAKSGS